MSDQTVPDSHASAGQMKQLAKDFSRNREVIRKLSDRLTRAQGILTAVQRDLEGTQDEFDRIAKRVNEAMLHRAISEVLDRRGN